MRKIKFLIRAIAQMDYKNLFLVTKKVSKKAKKPYLFILFDVIYCGMKYQAGYMDYQEFEFYLLNQEQRKTFLTRGINNALVRKYNPKEYWHFLQNKVEFNERFESYLKRDWLDLRKSSFEEFEKFVKGKDFIVAKTVDGCGGKGVSKISVTSSLRKIYETLKKEKQYLVEEVIVQHPKLSDLNPSSVNTLRLFTFYDGKKSHVINSIFKIGNGGFVDNFSSGGMYTFVSKDGKLLVPAIDVEDHIIDVHPVTKKKIVGFQIPNYEKALELVKKASESIPEIQYIGWDVAITPKDVCLVEGNEFPGVFQMKPSFQKGEPEGVLKTYQKYMK